MGERLPIGLFDSGVGGLSVLRHVVDVLPHEDIVYVADQAFLPYGQKSAETIQQRAHQITDYLLTFHNCKLIVIPCNTATAAALDCLRDTYGERVAFVGVEPAVKPGAEATQSGRVGVLATEGTFGSDRYADLMRRFAADVVVFENPCIGLVELIEAGGGNSAEVEALLRPILEPMLADNIDTLVLGCTHYPFAIDTIRRIVGNQITIIDPAPAVARQTSRILEKQQLLNSNGLANIRCHTTAGYSRFAKQIATLIPEISISSISPISPLFPNFH